MVNFRELGGNQKFAVVLIKVQPVRATEARGDCQTRVVAFHYPTVTDLARLRGLSMLRPSLRAEK